MKKFLIVWNLLLSLIIVTLWLSVVSEDKSSYDITQNVVLCGYIEDIQNKVGIDTSSTPDCQGDIERVFNTVN